MADIEGKKLTELRVIDLKTELERRGLDKTGNKAALLDRLSKAIFEEGNDPDDYLIVPSGGIKASPKKPIDISITIEDVLETDIQKNEFNSTIDSSEQPALNTDDDNNENSVENTVDNSENIVDNDEPIINISAHPEELEMDYQETEQEPTVTTTSEEPAPEKETFITPDESSNVSAVETNGIDNEDSINLTIGEDEENLLAEETELNERPKADGGAKKSLEESDNLSLGSSNNNSNDDSNINKKGDSKGSGRAEVGASSSSSNTSASSSGNNNNNNNNHKEGISASSSTSTSASGANATNLKSKTDGEGSKSGEATAKGSKKDEKGFTVSPNASSRNLWVSGLSSTTRATDLKQIFSKYGKVIGAKVVTNARTPGSRCYGYVTMSTSDDAEKCIEHLHRTELHGRVISVEKAKGDSQQSHNRKREIASKTDKKDEKEKGKEPESEDKEAAEKTEDDAEDRGKKKDDESVKETDEKAIEESTSEREKRENSLENKDEGSLKDCDTRSNKSSSKKSDRERGNSREDKKRSWDRSRTSRSKSRERPRRDNVLSFDKIKEERERQRQREKERLMREEKRRRREDMERQRAIEREAARLEREREKLRLERERIEQEKAELLRLERERQKLEREKLERERLELKRQQMRLEENNRRGGPPGGSTSSAAGIKRTGGDRPRETYAEPERKRINAEHPSRRHSPERVPDNRRMDSASVAGRYENTRGKDPVPMHKNFKRTNDFSARNHRSDDQYDISNRQGIRRDVPRPNQNSMDHRPPKDRYERPSGFGRDREVHRSDDNHRTSRDNHNRYDNSKPNNPRDGRYVENNRQTGWHSGPPSKPFNSVNNRNEQSGWGERSSDSRMNNSRWNSNMGNNMGHPRSQMYQGGGGGGGPQSGYGHPQGNSGSYNRFDPYKGSMQNMRKY